MLFLTYDLETTGLVDPKKALDHPDQPDIVQFAALLQNDDRVDVGSLYMTLICHKEIPERAVQVHGITQEKSREIGVNREVGLECLLNMVEAADMIVGYNQVHYDNKVLTGFARRLFGESDFDPFADKSQFDVINAATAIMKKPRRGGGYSRPKLEEFYTHLFGEPFAGAHDARADVLATNDCFWKAQEIAKERASA